MSITKEKQYISEKFQKKLNKEQLFKEAISKHNGTFLKENKQEVIDKLYNKYKYFKDFFVKDIHTFKFNGLNLELLELAMIEHLFCKYSTTKALYYPFLTIDSFLNKTFGNQERTKEVNQFLFFLEIVHGSSPYKLYTKKFLTKNETHFLFTCNEYKTLEKNLMFMILKPYNFSKKFIENVIESKFMNYIEDIYKNYNEPTFIANVEALKNLFEIVGKNKKTITIDILEELYDYLFHNRNIFNTLKGRSLNALIQLSNEWHIEQIFRKETKASSWNKIYKDYTYEVNGIKKAQFFELTSSTQLLNEGKMQHHCVGSYVSRCQSGRVSIFASMVANKKGPTIEVENQPFGGQSVIIQVKRKFNTDPTKLDLMYLEKFAAFHNLKISKYIVNN